LPVPLAPDVIVIQVALLTAVQVQPLPEVIVTAAFPVPPLPETGCDVGATVNAHGAAWFTVTVCPAMVSVRRRADVPVFAVVLYVTVPLPVPLAPAVTVIQVALLVAVQVQPVCVVTFTVELPPAAGSASVVGATVNVHGAL